MTKISLNSDLVPNDAPFAEVGAFYVDVKTLEPNFYILSKICSERGALDIYQLTNLCGGVGYVNGRGSMGGSFGGDMSDFRKLKPGEKLIIEIE